ncbi:MAG: hypothetical protein KDI17_14910 [Halioglobus sp.]|nr:hypothetical protein [Halioglobus sp.]
MRKAATFTLKAAFTVFATVAALSVLLPNPAVAQAGSHVENPTSVWGNSGAIITRGSPRYYSESGNHYLVFQDDGNLVVYSQDGTYIWGLDKVSNQLARAQFIDFIDGNLNVRDQNANLLWQAVPGQPSGAATLRLKSDGTLQMYTCRSQGNAGGVSWSSNGNTSDAVENCAGNGNLAEVSAHVTQPSNAATPTPVAPGSPESIWGKSDAIISRGSPKYYSESGNHYLVFQQDGNLVVYTKDGSYVWGLDKLSDQLSRAQFVDVIDGNLNVRDQNANILWQAAPGQPSGPATLRLKSDGTLQMVACRSQGNAGGVSWSSNGNTSDAVENCAGNGNLAEASAPAPQPNTAPAPAAVTQTVPVNTPVAPSPQATQPDSGPATGFPIRPGQSIVPGKKYASPDGLSYLQFSPDGNLVIKAVVGDRFLWGLNKQQVTYQNVKQVKLLADGRLVAGDAKGDILWTPVGSDAASNSFLTLENAMLKVVSPSGQTTWSSNEAPAAPPAQSEKLPLPPYENGKCTPDPGYAKCRVIDSPRIFINGTSKVSDSAMDIVKKIYTDMTARLTPAYPKSNLNWVKVAITNGESSAELAQLPGIGDNGRSAADNDFLRGGGGPNLVWITEQMICKNGVATRKDDTSPRTFDQVIHEFGHTMDFRFDRRKLTEQIYKSQPIQPAEEGFPWAIQCWFGAPANVPILQLPPIRADMEAMFASQTTYDCNDYKP